MENINLDDNCDLVIYFGDHLESDVKAVRTYTNWLAACVLEELDATHSDESEQHAHKSATAEEKRQERLQQLEESPYQNLNVSRQWGAFFLTNCGHVSM
ncbi:MAG: hypothetical protein MHM6MM_005260 [Cercozoa sp. M6MM]